MSEQSIKFDYRKWRGEQNYMSSAYRKYDFPVHVRRIGEPAPQSGR
ncbi:hypothetical protein [Streptomyces ardesiacus]